MPRKQIKDLIAELRSWLPNYDHGPKDYPTILYRVLATVPGGEELEDMGYEPIGEHFGWHELEQLGRVLTTIESERDVQDLIAGLTAEETEEDLGEAPVARETVAEEASGVPRLADDHPWGHETTQAQIEYRIKWEREQEKLHRGEWNNAIADAHALAAKAYEDLLAKMKSEGRGESRGMREAPQPANEDAAHELALYTINDGDIYRRTIQPIIKNLAKKIRNGTYDRELAVKAWAYAADAGAQKYTKEFGGSGNGSYGSFTKADRMEAAKEIAEQYDEELQAAAGKLPVLRRPKRAVHAKRSR